jgi:hypothetical protein
MPAIRLASVAETFPAAATCKRIAPQGGRKTVASEQPIGVPAARCASAGRKRLIPTPSDQNPCAQSRSPMDMMVQGRSTSLFQAWQQ